MHPLQRVGFVGARFLHPLPGFSLATKKQNQDQTTVSNIEGPDAVNCQAEQGANADSRAEQGPARCYSPFCLLCIPTQDDAKGAKSLSAGRRQAKNIKCLELRGDTSSPKKS